MEKKIAEFALDFEKRGTTLYLELAFRVKNSLSKNLFYTLAKQEIDHAKKIDEFYMGAGERIYPAGHKNMNSVEDEIKTFFERVKNTVLKEESNLEVYEAAMKLEKEGYSAYERFLRESTDDREKQLLKFLLNEEKNHLEAIANVYSYLSETSDWLEQEESRTWNWMNI